MLSHHRGTKHPTRLTQIPVGTFHLSSNSATVRASPTTNSDAQDASPRNILTLVTCNADEGSRTSTTRVNVTIHPCGGSLEVDTGGQDVVVPQGSIATGRECANVVATGGSGAGIDDGSRGQRKKEEGDDGELHDG